MGVLIGLHRDQLVGLVTIDFQLDFLESGPCACEGAMPAAIRAQAISGVMRAHGFPVAHILTRHVQDLSIPLRDRERGLRYCLDGTPGMEAVLGLVADGDAVIWKRSYDGFLNTSLEAWIAKENVGHVLLAGVKSTCCVIATGIGFLVRDIPLTVLLDACAPLSARPLLREIFDKKCHACCVLETDSAISLMRRGTR